MPLFTGIPQTDADALRGGAADAYGQVPERQISDGSAPCRCCLSLIAKGADMLVLAYRPFTAAQPYAETGPVFLCAAPCQAYPSSATEPGILVSPDYLLKGYDRTERLVYGTGRITPLAEIPAYADYLLSQASIEFVDLRSARNNCWQARLYRA